MAYGTIVNGGVLLKPQDAWNDPPTRVRRVISDKTASTIRAMLGRVVSMKGTAPLAKLDGVSAGGKTGTAQVILPGGRYSPDRYVTLFAGFYPVEKPRVVCVVVVDQAQVSPDCNYGGLIAAPVFARICNHAVKCGF
jgi:cell division protein FtsI/penicillin-binding protein 2